MRVRLAIPIILIWSVMCTITIKADDVNIPEPDGVESVDSLPEAPFDEVDDESSTETTAQEPDEAYEEASSESESSESSSEDIDWSTGWIDVTGNHGVEKKILVEGRGATVPSGATVRAHYHGTLEDGTTFDSSYKRGEPLEFTVGNDDVIECWDEGFQTMKLGEKVVFKCRADYAYGKEGIPGSIPPKSTLNFEVEVVGVMEGSGGYHGPTPEELATEESEDASEEEEEVAGPEDDAASNSDMIQPIPKLGDRFMSARNGPGTLTNVVVDRDQYDITFDSHPNEPLTYTLEGLRATLTPTCTELKVGCPVTRHKNGSKGTVTSMDGAGNPTVKFSSGEDAGKEIYLTARSVELVGAPAPMTKKDKYMALRQERLEQEAALEEQQYQQYAQQRAAEQDEMARQQMQFQMMADMERAEAEDEAKRAAIQSQHYLRVGAAVFAIVAIFITYLIYSAYTIIN